MTTQQTDPRSQAILAEVSALSQPRKTTLPQQPAQSEQLSREELILREVGSIASQLPETREMAILGEVDHIAARRAQPIISGAISGETCRYPDPSLTGSIRGFVPLKLFSS